MYAARVRQSHQFRDSIGLRNTQNRGYPPKTIKRCCRVTIPPSSEETLSHHHQDTSSPGRHILQQHVRRQAAHDNRGPRRGCWRRSQAGADHVHAQFERTATDHALISVAGQIALAVVELDREARDSLGAPAFARILDAGVVVLLIGAGAAEAEAQGHRHVALHDLGCAAREGALVGRVGEVVCLVVAALVLVLVGARVD